MGKSFNLTSPITGPSGEMTVIELKDITGAMLLKHGRAVYMDQSFTSENGDITKLVQDDAVANKYIPLITGLPMAMIEMMDPLDIIGLQQQVFNFFMNILPKG